MKAGVDCCMMVCLAVKQLMFYVRERVIDNLLNPFTYNFIKFITINKWLRKVCLVSTDLMKYFRKVS